MDPTPPLACPNRPTQLFVLGKVKTAIAMELCGSDGAKNHINGYQLNLKAKQSVTIKILATPTPITRSFALANKIIYQLLMLKFVKLRKNS